MSLKFTNLGQQPNNQLSMSSENFRADRYWLDKQFNPCHICSKCFGFRVISQNLHVSPMFYFKPWQPSWFVG